MKKTLFTVAAITAIVSVASADDTWFNGGINGETLSGGSWSTATGVTTTGGKYELSDVDSYKFTATTAKSASEAKLCFQSNVKFQYAYDALPEIGVDDKAGVIVFGQGADTNYYVLAKVDNANPAANKWVAANGTVDLDHEVVVTITISNGTDSVWAVYDIGGSVTAKEIVAASDEFQVVDYSGSGVIASLVGSFLLQGYSIPGNGVIATEAGNAWAKKFGYAQDKLAAILISEATYTGNRTAAESCILGVATNAEINASIDDTGVAADKLQFTVQLDGDKIIDGHNVEFQLQEKTAGSVGSAQSELVFNPDLAVGEYSIVAFIDGANKEIPVSKAMGVTNAPASFAGSAAAGFCAVPYNGADGDIAISDLFKKALLVEGDQLDIFDSETAGWKTFKFEDGAWKGIVKNDVTPDPATTTIKRGQAFKLSRGAGASAAPVYLGYVSTEKAVVTLPSKKYELVAEPDGSAFALDKLGADDWAAKVDVNAVLPTAMYKNKGDAWKVITYEDGVPKESDASTVDGPVFLLNRGSQDKDIEL